MGDKGRRIVRETRDGKVTQSDNLKNLSKDELDDFNDGWCDAAGELNFDTGQSNKIGYGGYNPNRKALGNGQRRRT